MANNINNNNNNVEQQRKQWPRRHQQLGPDNNMEHTYRRAIWNYSRRSPKTTKVLAQKQHLTTVAGTQKQKKALAQKQHETTVAGARQQYGTRNAVASTIQKEKNKNNIINMAGKT